MTIDEVLNDKAFIQSAYDNGITYADLMRMKPERLIMAYEKFRCLEDRNYIEKYFVYENDGYIYDRETGQRISKG